MSEAQKVDRVLTLRIGRDLERSLDREARRRRTTKSELVRQLLAHGLGTRAEVSPGEARRQSLLASERDDPTFRDLIESAFELHDARATPAGDAAVLVPIEEWRRLTESTRPTFKELLLADSPRADLVIPSRKTWRRRTPEALD